jgi:hypothetical protein
MCTLLALRRPGHHWPLLLAANRDEMADRPWRPPGRHWPDRPEVVAGYDEAAGGSWLGLNDHGLAAAILNRVGSLGPGPGKRSRGELVLEALDHAEAAEAAHALTELNAAAYRSFNLVVADAERAFWLRNRDEPGAPIERFELPEGLSMLTAHDRNDMASPRIRDYLPRFAQAPEPDPERGDWHAWTALLGSRVRDGAGAPLSAMTVATERGFGTTSSALIALPDLTRPELATAAAQAPKPVFLFAAGPPDRTPFEPVAGL